MRRSLMTALVLGLAVTPLAGAGANPVEDLVVGLNAPVLTSDNVTYHGTIPLDSPGVGGEVVVREDLGGKKFFYVTGLKGLSIYDVTLPFAPVLTGHMPFPHSQNEDLKVSDDGTRAVIAADGALLLPVAPATTGIHIVDTTDPMNPHIIGSSNAFVRGDGTSTAARNEHTAECANADCTVIYGRSGRIYEFNEETGVVEDRGVWNRNLQGGSVGGIHALNRDETGVIISDSNPRLVLDPGVIDPDATPLTPTVLAQGLRASQDPRLQHNNVRTDATEWRPRHNASHGDGKGKGRKDRIETAVEGEDFEVNPRSISVRDERDIMYPGEMFLGNSESNLNTMCATAGGLSTWSMVNFDKEDFTELRQLEVFRPLNGTWLDGDPRVNALGCSGHWFTENDGIVAGSWYEHGVRFFDVDKEVGTIEEIGYFQPVVTEAGAAYWIDDRFVYSVDYARGIDIVSFDPDPSLLPTQSELDAAWIANLGMVGAAAEAERMYCALAASE